VTPGACGLREPAPPSQPGGSDSAVRTLHRIRGGALTVISFLPQVVRVWKTKKTNDLSLETFVILITAGALWITYGVVTLDLPVIATTAVWWR